MVCHFRTVVSTCFSEDFAELWSANQLCNAGRGLGGFTTVFDAEDQPAWLKSIALRFAVVASKILDEAVPEYKQPAMSANWPQIAPATQEQETEQTPASTEEVLFQSLLIH